MDEPLSVPSGTSAANSFHDSLSNLHDLRNPWIGTPKIHVIAVICGFYNEPPN